MGFGNLGLWKVFLFSPCKIKASQERTSILYFGLWEHLFFQIKELPVLFHSVRYRAQELSDQGSQDAPAELFPLTKPGCSIFKCLLVSCLMLAAVPGCGVCVSALKEALNQIHQN